MPLFVHKRFPSLSINYDVVEEVVPVGSGKSRVTSKWKTIKFEKCQYYTKDPREIEHLRNHDDFKLGVMTEIKDQVAEKDEKAREAAAKKEIEGEKVYSCPVCKQSCKSKAGLAAHMRKHDEEDKGELQGDADEGSGTE
jgi:hypothetical protein